MSSIDFEVSQALTEIDNAIKEIGDVVVFQLNTEKNISRGSLNSIKQTNKNVPKYVNIHAHPIIFSPSKRDLMKAGVSEESEVIIYTSSKEWAENGISRIEDISLIKTRIEIDGQKFEIKDKTKHTRIKKASLYYVFGLFHK